MYDMNFSINVRNLLLIFDSFLYLNIFENVFVKFIIEMTSFVVFWIKFLVIKLVNFFGEWILTLLDFDRGVAFDTVSSLINWRDGGFDLYLDLWIMGNLYDLKVSLNDYFGLSRLSFCVKDKDIDLPESLNVGNTNLTTSAPKSTLNTCIIFIRLNNKYNNRLYTINNAEHSSKRSLGGSIKLRSSSRHKLLNFPGFSNLGNSCFISCSLKILLNSGDCVKRILQPIGLTNGSFSSVFQEFVSSYFINNASFPDLYNELKLFPSFDNFTTGRQCSVFDFLMKVMSEFHLGVNLTSLFEFRMCYNYFLEHRFIKTDLQNKLSLELVVNSVSANRRSAVTLTSLFDKFHDENPIFY